MKKLIVALIAVAVLWLIWPYYAVYDLASSINKADPAGLQRRIEWTSVRQGLREDLSKFLSRNTPSPLTGQGFPGPVFFPGAALNTGLGAMIGPALIEKTLDAVVTPQTIAALIAQSKMTARSGNAAGFGATREPRQRLKLSNLKYAFFSGGPFDFRVEIASTRSADAAPLVLLFKWDGDWRLTRISASRKTIEAMASSTNNRWLR